MPGVRISQAHGTVRPVDPATGARDAMVLAMYHPAAALRSPAVERESYEDAATIPAVLLDARARRAGHQATGPVLVGAGVAVTADVAPEVSATSAITPVAEPSADTDQMTLF
jgi:hypothetical protein